MEVKCKKLMFYQRKKIPKQKSYAYHPPPPKKRGDLNSNLFTVENCKEIISSPIISYYKGFQTAEEAMESDSHINQQNTVLKVF